MASVTDTFKVLKRSLTVFDSANIKRGKELKALERITAACNSLKDILSEDLHPDAEVSISNSFNEFIVPLIQNLYRFEFEARKDIALAFCRITRIQVAGASPTVDYIVSNPHVLDLLFAGYDIVSVSIHTGSMIRGCIEREEIARAILSSENFFKLFDYIESPSFDIATDAFSTFKELLTKHKLLTSDFLERNYDQVFAKYANLLNSENYVTKRQSLKLLGELLLDKVNFNVMTRYISFSRNLKLMMTLLCDDSRSIQFEAFHVFKIFVANPHKPEPISNILKKNQTSLTDFLNQFHNENDDEQFSDEKSYLLKQIQLL